MSGHSLNVFFKPVGTGLTTLPNTPGVYTSDWQSIEHDTGYAFQVDYDAAISGTLSVECRVAGMSPVANTEINAQLTAIAASAGSQLINVSDAYYDQFRIVYTHVSGAGVLSAGAYAKGA